MDTREIDWSLYRTFLAAVETGSLSGAARRLGLTQPTVGRQIDALEDGLGLALFTRSRHGLAPTAAALDLVDHAEAMASAAQALARAATGEAAEERGTVRLTASEMVGAEVLPPILTGFRRAHPRIEIELALTNRNEDLLRRDADIAVRMARPTQEALVARRVGAVEIGLYAHRDYAAAHGLPETEADFRRHSIIGYDRDLTTETIAGRAGFTLRRHWFALRSDNDLAQLAALRAGFGIGGAQVAIAAREPELVRVMPDRVRLELEMWLAMHEDLRASRRVRLMFDHLVEGLSDYVREGVRAAARSGW